MKRLAGMLLIGVLTALILQPVSPRVNSPFNNQPTRADGFPIPPIKPPMLVADGFPIPPIPPTLVADGFPIPPIPPALVADGFPIPPIPPTMLVSGAIWAA
jgi:hypothetical protein